MPAARRRIDTHQHIVPPFYRRWLLDLGLTSGGKAIPEWSEDAALEIMEVNEIETAIVSVSTPGVEPATGTDARSRARELNEYSAELCRKYPGRFGFFATLTLPDIDGALAEAAYALDELQADGVVLLGNARGTYLGDRLFLPLMEELNRRACVIFVHPSELRAPAVGSIPAHAADFLLDTTRAALNMARNGWMERFSDTKIILAHAGGFLPFAAQRMAANATETGIDENGIRSLRKFYFDTALSGSKYALPSLLAFADPARITYGSDFPYAPAERGRQFTARLDAYEDLDHGATDRGNAEQLFPRYATPVPVLR